MAGSTETLHRPAGPETAPIPARDCHGYFAGNLPNLFYNYEDAGLMVARTWSHANSRMWRDGR